MTDLMSMLGALRRPRLLIRAARFGVEHYRRGPALRRLIQTEVPGHGATIMKLMAIEAELNEARINGDANYSVARHVDVMIALMGEAALMKSSSRPMAA